MLYIMAKSSLSNGELKFFLCANHDTRPPTLQFHLMGTTLMTHFKKCNFNFSCLSDRALKGILRVL